MLYFCVPTFGLKMAVIHLSDCIYSKINLDTFNRYISCQLYFSTFT